MGADDGALVPPVTHEAAVKVTDNPSNAKAPTPLLREEGRLDSTLRTMRTRYRAWGSIGSHSMTFDG